MIGRRWGEGREVGGWIDDRKEMEMERGGRVRDDRKEMERGGGRRTKEERKVIIRAP